MAVAVPIPYSKVNVSSGLGVVSAQVDGECLIIGSSTLGVAGTIYSFRGSDTSNARATLGKGDAVEALVRQCIDSEGKTCHFLKVTPTTAGSSSAVTASGGGPTVTLTGVPHSSSQTIMRVTKGGAIATSTVQFSFDGGDTYGENVATAATIVLETGVTANLAVGTYVLGETYSWTDTAPAMTSGDIATAMDAYAVHAINPEFVRIAGFPALASDSATIATMLAGKVTTAEGMGKFPIVVMEFPPVDKATVISAMAAFANDWMIGIGGFCELSNITTGRVEKRPASFVMVPRLSRNAVTIDGSRNTTDTDLEPHSGVRLLVPQGSVAASGYHNEASTPGFAAARISSLLTFPGREGFFGNFLSLAGSSSDFGLIADQRLMRKLQRNLFQWQLRQLNTRVRVNGAGRIAAGFRAALEDSARSYLADAVSGDEVSSIAVAVDDTNNVLTTQRLNIKVSAIPPGHARALESTLAFAVNIPD